MQKIIEQDNTLRGTHFETLLLKGKSEVQLSGFGARGGPLLHATIGKAVCVKCNSGWMAAVQETMTKLFRRSHACVGPGFSISNDEVLACRNWLCTRIILHGFSYPANKFLPPNICSKFEAHRALSIGYFNKSRLMPADWEAGVAFAINRVPFDKINPNLHASNYLPFSQFMVGAGVRELRFGFVYVIHLANLVLAAVSGVEQTGRLSRHFASLRVEPETSELRFNVAYSHSLLETDLFESALGRVHAGEFWREGKVRRNFS